MFSVFSNIVYSAKLRSLFTQRPYVHTILMLSIFKTTQTHYLKYNVSEPFVMLYYPSMIALIFCSAATASALPRLFFITKPTMALIAFSLPFL